MQAIILAAGMGRRLKELTQNNTKCMVKVCGITLIERLLRQLDGLRLEKIVIVVGYEGQKLIDFIGTLNIHTHIDYIDNPVYDKTNNIYSLYLARGELVNDDTLLFESDIIISDGIIESMINDPRDTIALVDKYEPWMDGTCVELNEDDEIINFVPGSKFDYTKRDSYFKTVNIYKFSKHFSKECYVPFLKAYQSALGENEYYEQVLRVITMLDNPEIKAKRLSGEKWYEIDDVQDLDIATTLFADDDERLSLMQGRYGGYWRYPKLLDFCYLVNPYFPPKKMVEEMKASFYELLTQYPSGMKVNSLIASKNFGVKQEHIVVGNGAAELIKSLMEGLDGKVGVIRPTFEEYPNRLSKELQVVFTPDNPEFSYMAEDLISYFSDKDISTLVLINPDNPTGSYIPKEGLLRLIEWTKEKDIKLVVDESFADFADEPDNTLIDEAVINDNPHLFVMKSISKSFGVPGLRLGVLVSSDSEAISRIKKDVSIWNINSFGEFYMQIYEKYAKNYKKALAKFRTERARYISELGKIRGLRVIPSQANYVMVELTNGRRAYDVTRELLVMHDIFIKDLSKKVSGGEYLRLAVRNNKDNDRLLSAMKCIMLPDA